MIILAKLCIMQTKNHCLLAIFGFICFFEPDACLLLQNHVILGTIYQHLRTIYFKISCKIMWNNSVYMFNLTFLVILSNFILLWTYLWHIIKCGLGVCVNPSKLEHFSYFYHILTQYVVFSLFNVFNISNWYWIDTFNRFVDCWWHGKTFSPIFEDPVSIFEIFCQG